MTEGLVEIMQGQLNQAADEIVRVQSGHADLVLPIYFLIFTLAWGAFIQQMLSAYCPSLPYTVVMLLFGVLWGSIYGHGFFDWGPIITRSFDAWVNIDSHLMLYMFLPVLLFGDSMGLNWHLVKKCFKQCLLLAGPGVLLGTVLVTVFSKLLLRDTQFDGSEMWTWPRCLMFGSVLAATDPVAVVGILKSLGVSPKLTMIITGESLMNDGVAIVLFLFFARLAMKDHPGLNDYYINDETLIPSLDSVPDLDNIGGLIGFGFTYFLKVAFVGAWIGFCWGLGFEYWIKTATSKSNHTDTLVQITLTITCAYSSFFCAEKFFSVSGVLATVVAAVTVGSHGWEAFTSREQMGHFWHALEYLFNTILFFLSGMILGRVCRDGDTVSKNWLNLLALYVACTVIRFLLVGLFYPIMSRLGYGFTRNEAIVLAWGGLRGAVGLALAIDIQYNFYKGPCSSYSAASSSGSASSLYSAAASGNGTSPPGLGQDQCDDLKSFTDQAFFFIGGFAVLTLLINGTTTGMLLQRLGFMGSDDATKALVQAARAGIDQSVREKYDKVSKTLYVRGLEGDLLSCVENNCRSMKRTSASAEEETSAFSSGLAEGEKQKAMALLFLSILRSEHLKNVDEGLVVSNMGTILVESVDRMIESLKTDKIRPDQLDDLDFIIQGARVGENNWPQGLLNCLGKCYGYDGIIDQEWDFISKSEASFRKVAVLLNFSTAHRRALATMKDLLCTANKGSDITKDIVVFKRSEEMNEQAVKLLHSVGMVIVDAAKVKQVSFLLLEEQRVLIEKYKAAGMLTDTQAHDLAHDIEHDIDHMNQQDFPEVPDEANETASTEMVPPAPAALP